MVLIFMKGKILFKYGNMSSGKSLHLLATAHNFEQHSIPFLIFKSNIDNRDGENVFLRAYACLTDGTLAPLYGACIWEND